jgi:hypothetical protein
MLTRTGSPVATQALLLWRLFRPDECADAQRAHALHAASFGAAPSRHGTPPGEVRRRHLHNLAARARAASRLGRSGAALRRARARVALHCAPMRRC